MANRRIAGPKAWGGGRVIFTFKAERQRLLDALAASCRSASETERDHLRPAHDAETREQAMREQMEADCKEVCLFCGNDFTAYEKTPQKRFAADDFVHVRKEESSPDVFLNDYEDCCANDIRTAYAKAHPKAKS